MAAPHLQFCIFKFFLIVTEKKSSVVQMNKIKKCGKEQRWKIRLCSSSEHLVDRFEKEHNNIALVK